MKYILLITAFFLSHIHNAQVLTFSGEFKQEFNKLRYTDNLPEGLLKGKTAIIYLTEAKGWKKTAEEVQKGLKQASIDGVAHFHISEIHSGIESKKAYMQQLSDREIDFLLYYLENPIPQIVIFPFKDSLLTNNAFSITHEKRDDLLRNLYRLSARSTEDISNLLILEVPAYMNYPKVVSGRRAEFYDLNMKSGKLAIPQMEDSLLNQEIDSIMAAYYPFEYGFVEPGLSQDELRKKGYWFILYGVQGSGKLVRNLLEYNTSKEETAYASVVVRNGKTEVKTYPVDQHVVKFYIKDVKNNDVFLGKQYDADVNWQSALINYIFHLKAVLDR